MIKSGSAREHFELDFGAGDEGDAEPGGDFGGVAPWGSLDFSQRGACEAKRRGRRGSYFFRKTARCLSTDFPGASLRARVLGLMMEPIWMAPRFLRALAASSCSLSK